MATPTYFTLEYNAEEKTFAEWGLEGPERNRISQRASTFNFRQPGAKLEADPIIPFEGWIKIRKRGGTTPGGGPAPAVILFQGRRVLAPVEGRPDFEGISYEISDPWYDLENIAFQQTRKVPNADYTGLVDDHTSELFLYQKLDGTRQNTGEQIREILQWAIARGAPMQIGAIEVAVNMISYQVKDITCAEAIQYCLKPSPNVTAWIDAKTEPPTFHVLKTSAAKTLALADGESHEGTQLTPRPDLQVPAVSLKFKRTNTQNGFSWIEPMNAAPNWQVWPPGATGLERRAIVATIDLQGYSRTDVTGSLICDAVLCNDGSADTRRTWWAGKHPQLASDKLSNFVIGAATIKAKDGTALSLATYPNEVNHEGGNLAPWMRLEDETPVIGREATIEATIAYDQEDDNGQLRQSVVKSFSTSVMLTNGVTGDYRARGDAITAEDIPTDLAKDYYEALQALQYQGQHVHVDPSGEIQDIIGMENVLNLSGGRPEWATMEAVIQSIHEDFETATTTITVGPAAHLSPADLAQLFLVNRWRYFWTDPSTRSTGKTSAGGSVALTKQTAKQDTNHGLDESSVSTVAHEKADGTSWIQHDAVGEAILMHRADSDGVPIASAGRVAIRLSDLVGTNKEMIAREFRWNDVTTCLTWRAWIAMTEPEPVT